MLFISLVVLLTAPVAFAGQSQAPVDCADARACGELALHAAAEQEYERMHDLAWRAMQKSPKPNPDVMYLLARAQALSGRPGDALVMLSRLADMKVPTDAATHDDFRRVRALAGWPDLQARIDAAAAIPANAEAGLKAGVTGEAKAGATGDAKVGLKAGGSADAKAAGTAPVVVPTFRSASPIEDAIHFNPSGLIPGGLAYDGVSRRFLIADQRGRKLAVVDEFSRSVATLAGAQAGFGDVDAMEIDPREGNLWVVSDGSDAGTKLHKLQLISGRVLTVYDLASEFLPAHFVDVAVGQDGTVLVLDSTRGRVFRLADAALEAAAEIPSAGPASIAPAQSGVAFVAHASSIARVDLHTKTVTAVTVPPGTDLAGIARLRWDRGSLVAVQKAGDQYRAIRITLDPAARRVTGVEVLDPGFVTRDPAAATIAAGTLDYLVDGNDADVTVRKIRLR